MFRPRIIPVLLLKNLALVKSVQFKKHKYIGDPINAVRIFNDLKADELIFLDIAASLNNKLISLKLVENVGEEANMPFAVGGGIKSIEDIRKVISAGAEKVVINSYAVENPDFIREAADVFGSSTIVVCIDVKKKFFGGKRVWVLSGTKSTGYTALEFARLMEKNGAGEVIIQSIEKDGMMEGYDVELTKLISTSINIPVVALGGAGTLADLSEVYENGYANALAAGSLFVYHNKNRGVLINYPAKNERHLSQILNDRS